MLIQIVYHATYLSCQVNKKKFRLRLFIIIFEVRLCCPYTSDAGNQNIVELTIVYTSK